MLEGLYFFLKNHFHVLNLTISCQTLHVTVQVPAKLCQFKRCIVGMVKQLEHKKRTSPSLYKIAECAVLAKSCNLLMPNLAASLKTCRSFQDFTRMYVTWF